MIGAKVLIVEDNPVNLRLAQFVLERKGFTVTEAASASECMAQLEKAVPDLILMDIQLPGEDGLSVTRKIRANPKLKRIVIVALTAHAMTGDREKILAAGCDGYLAKPMDPQRLAGEVDAYLRAAGGRGTAAAG
jgi:two-component system cell cycle response regulator